jgi:3-oxoacyl-[acyl-carrier-protein] synthase II
MKGDAIEATAINRIFSGERSQLYVSSTKGATGHLLGAAGALEATFCALTIRDNIIPPTLNLKQTDDCNFTHVTEAKHLNRPIKNVMTNSFGFGGVNATLVLSRYEKSSL